MKFTHFVIRIVSDACMLVSIATAVIAQTADGLVANNVSIAQTTFKGRSSIQVTASPGVANGASYAVVKDRLFRDGTIEVDLAGQPAAGAGGGARQDKPVQLRPTQKTIPLESSA